MVRHLSRAPCAPTVSIGLPVYNGAEYLKLALESVLAQTYSDFEVILCDNASTDGTAEIAQGFDRIDDRISYHRNSVNLGSAKNFNRTLELARGKYFKWFAHDDLLGPSYLQAAVEALESSSEEVVLCVPQVQYIDEVGSTLDEARGLKIQQRRTRASFQDISLASLLRLPPPCCPIPVFGLARTDALRRTRGIGAFVMSDLVTVAELRMLGRFVELPQRLFFQRVYRIASSRAERRSPQGEAAWYDPQMRPVRVHPTARLIKEYCRSIWRLSSGLDRLNRPLLLLGFLEAAARRAVLHRVFRVWTRLSTAAVRCAPYTSLPLRFWMVGASLRRADLKGAAAAFRRPWTYPGRALLSFGTGRLARRHDRTGMLLLLEWARAPKPDRAEAAALAIATAPERFARLQRELRGKGKNGPSVATLLSRWSLGDEVSKLADPFPSERTLEQLDQQSEAQHGSPAQ